MHLNHQLIFLILFTQEREQNVCSADLQQKWAGILRSVHVYGM